MAILLCSTRARWGRTLKFILKKEGGEHSPKSYEMGDSVG